MEEKSGFNVYTPVHLGFHRTLLLQVSSEEKVGRRKVWAVWWMVKTLPAKQLHEYSYFGEV
jgi:hypothetical protein